MSVPKSYDIDDTCECYSISQNYEFLYNKYRLLIHRQYFHARYFKEFFQQIAKDYPAIRSSKVHYPTLMDYVQTDLSERTIVTFAHTGIFVNSERVGKIVRVGDGTFSLTFNNMNVNLYRKLNFNGHKSMDDAKLHLISYCERNSRRIAHLQAIVPKEPDGKYTFTDEK